MTDYWSSFWAEANLTSFRDSFASNYDAQIAEFWRAQFSKLASGSQMLDICSGNGAIALLAYQYAQEQDISLRIVATDAAQIHRDAVIERFPELEAPLNAIEVVDETRIEELELPGQSFDLISSQFGIEYCDVASAAPRIATLLKPGGRFVIVSHTADSPVMQTMRDDELDFALEQDLGILNALQDYVTNKLGFAQLRAILRRGHERLVQACQEHEAPLRIYLRDSVNNMLASPEPLFRVQKQRLRGFIENLEQGRGRLGDLLGVRELMASKPDWHQPFAKAGLVMTGSRALYQGEDSEALAKVLAYHKPTS